MVKRNIFSVIDGDIIAIEEVADPVFSEKMLGDGVAIRPAVKKTVVISPCDGVIQTLNASKHAVALLTDDGHEILIHIGIDTVLLKGEGFTSFVKVGDKIKLGEKLIEVDFPAIVNKVPSLDVVIIATNLGDDKKLLKNRNSKVRAGETLFSISGSDEPVDSFESESSKNNSFDTIVSPPCKIINESGVHARPASMIFQIANKYKAKVEIKKGDKLGNAKSIIAILGLGIKFNDEVFVVASGEDAQVVINELVEAIRFGLGEGSSSHVGESSKEEKAKEGISQENNMAYDFSKEVILSGVSASPGLVIGESFLLEEEKIDVHEVGQSPAEEQKALDNAISNVKATIIAEINEAKVKKQNTKIEVFEAHLTILQDELLLQGSESIIKNGKSAAFAWKESIINSINILNATKDKLLMERVADFKDIKRRVLKSILGLDSHSNSYPKNSIIIAKDLVPSDVVKFEDSEVSGVVLSLGSSTSHVSLILRNMGIPTLVAVGNLVMSVKNHASIILDANKGLVTINPDEIKMKAMKEEQIRLENVRAENMANAKKPAITKDGMKVLVKGNVSNTKEAGTALDLGADGVGLLRTEFLFFNSKNAPSEEEQNILYQGAVDAMQGLSVTLRTLDVGGDKPLPYVKIAHEENPILGMRGVRNYFTNKDIFLTQLRAILAIKPLLLAKIMIPMISDVAEIIAIKEIINEEKARLGIKDEVQIGTMIEVPSAALMSEQIAKHVDFLSIGTNDLAQYTLAMDRGNPVLTSRLKNLHPSILRLIKMTVDGGNKQNIPTSVCGAMASEVQSIPILIGLGITELSTSMKSIPEVRALIRELSYERCKMVAQKALDLISAEEVLSLVKSEFNL